MITDKQNKFMLRAIQWAEKGVEKGGGPFGAIIVKGDEIIAQSHNSVALDNDPTAHAEVNVIRQACRTLGTFDLSGCEIYTSCEPCPMCLASIYWAGIKSIYYGCTQEDAKNIDFDDSFIYDEIALAPDKRSIPTKQLLHSEAIKAFKMWEDKEDKIKY